ncbi:MAG: ABC-2 type transport system ATP-binding protein [Myxococcota bacterium]
MTPAVHARGLRRSFGSVLAVDGVDLDVGDHGLFGIVGPDAAGKTTLLRMLVGVLTPDAGSLQILGDDALGPKGRNRLLIGYMSQKFSLYEDLTVAENIAFFGALRRVPRADRERRAARVLDATGLAPFTKRYAGNLSGGMKQKLGLVCTLVHEPRVLFLDEPTNGVDPVSRREFWSILGELRQRIAVVVATPSLDEAERCDRVALMVGGRIQVTDTPRGLRERVVVPVHEVEVESPFPAAEAVEAAFPGVSVQLFGDRLHVAGEVGPDALGAALSAAGHPTQVRRISPSLEDAYVQILGGEAA